MKLLGSIAAILTLMLAGFRAAPTPLEYDVVVYGATAGGVTAAYTARIYGKTVLLVEPGRHLGGMTSGGLGQTDIGNKYAITGLARDFYRRVGRVYGRLEAWKFEPAVAEQVLEDYVDRAGVEILYSRRLTRVVKDGTRIREISLEYAGSGRKPDPIAIRGKVFIDATYEGDLMAMAGVSYHVGREANSVYDETLNGVQLMTGHQFPDGIDPYRIPGQPASGLLPEMTGTQLDPNGTGDRKVQAYNFRMCLCRADQNPLPITMPDGYDPARYELLARLLEKRPWKTLNEGFIISLMPDGKTDWNNRGGFSTDYIGRNWDYPEAGYAEREKIWTAHEDYQKGLLYFLGTEPRVPEHLRTEMKGWGYCRDEFLDTQGWPHQLYVREARRMIGEYVMTEHNCTGRVTVDDAIGMAAYTMDSHNIQRVVVGGMAKNEGNVEVGGFPPYPIAYRSITPKRKEVTNLLVPVALSASHIAYGSIRMEPVFMVLGQSAAVAASMAIDRGIPVQQVDVRRLQQELRDNPLADGSTGDVLVDDRDSSRVERTGPVASIGGREARGLYGPGALDVRAEGTVRFRPEIRQAGRYDVYLYWPSLRSDSLSGAAQVRIKHAGGIQSTAADMRARAEDWTKLGTFDFTPDAEGWIEIRNDDGTGRVIADAVLLVPEIK